MARRTKKKGTGSPKRKVRPELSPGYEPGEDRFGNPRFECLRCDLAYTAESEVREHIRRGHSWPMLASEDPRNATLKEEEPEPAEIEEAPVTTTTEPTTEGDDEASGDEAVPEEE